MLYNDKKEVSKDELVCRMLELNYNQKMGIVSLGADENNAFYPVDWASNDDYEYKNKVLAEAIQKGISIQDTELYNENVEGVKVAK